MHGFGISFSYRTASSTPWFCDMAYKVVKHLGSIPVIDVLGVCFITKLAKGGVQSKYSDKFDCKHNVVHKCIDAVKSVVRRLGINVRVITTLSVNTVWCQVKM